ncbi:MAG: tRNA 2-thiouridine(34) synthase MnmA [Candidatus Nealsonbacteria bacterium]
MPKKVIVAMSGGVDSSVAAALLKKQGFQVSGVFMRFWFSPSDKKVERWNRCCSLESQQRAKEVARILGIPFYVFNFEKEFKKRIVDRFLEEYRAGVTPNPCVVCNKEIKFGLLLEKALSLGVDFIATGHYVRRQGKKTLQGTDPEKDQSYFLWKLSQQQLSRVLFPVGGYTKPEVRKLAQKFKLPVAETPESQEICFVPGAINEFLQRYFKPTTGNIVDVSGKILGKHQGLIFYTIGQRKGIGLPQGPYWVKGKDFKKNLLIVTKNEKDLLEKELIAADVNWLSGKTPKLPMKVKAKIRYRSKLSSAVIYKLKTTNYKLIFREPQRAITPGQSVVFYKDEELLGGGIIK